MPISPAMIAAGSQLIGTAMGAQSTQNTNNQNTVMNWKMYQQQRRDALADWNMQNEYNSPEQQMARLKEAGLNPNLVYGNGATTQGANFKSPEMKMTAAQAPSYDGIGAAGAAGLAAYNDTRVKDAQINVMNEQIEMMRTDQQLKSLDFLSKQFDLNLKGELRQNSIEVAKATLEKMMADIKFTQNTDRRADTMQAQNIRESAARISRIAQENATSQVERDRIKMATLNLIQDSELKNIEIELRKRGINPNDPIIMRTLGDIISGPVNLVKEKMKKFWDMVTNMSPHL